MKRSYIEQLLALCLLLLFPLFSQAQSTVSGQVLDGNEPLIGATVIIAGTTDGTVTDFNGNFEVTSNRAFPWTLEISYTGYTQQDVVVTSARDNVNVSLLAGTVLTDQIVVSASRRREKVQEAPASISILGERQLSVSPQVDPVRNMINVPGVQIQQQSAARMNISMRGEALLFNTSVFPIMDYRSLVGPGIGTFQSDGAGISNIDIERIEVVRGPGSALYGPGVTAGVIHFITKNPIDNPGTSIELMGGTLNTLGGIIRHAGVSENKKFGYKINAHYKKGDEFTLDPVEDAEQIAKLRNQVFQPVVVNGIVDPTQTGELLLDVGDTDPDGNGNPMQEDWWNTALNATLEFRPQDDLSIFVSGGYNEASAVFYNSQGEGLSQTSEIWTQARMQKGGLFAQVFYVDNTGGTKEKPTFLYQTGFRTPVGRKQLEGQLQYNFDVPSLLNSNFTVGADYRDAASDTENLVYGRNEEIDDFTIFGAYAQGKFELGDKLDFILAGRYDNFNFLDEGSVSPRLALVYKASPKHTFRASYNRATSPPTALNIYIDFPVAAPAPGLFDVWLAGTLEAHTYDNPMIDLTLPGFPDLPYGTPGLPLAIAYGAVNDPVIAEVEAAFAGTPLEALFPAIEAFLRDPTNTPTGVTGNFTAYDLFTQQPWGELTSTQTPSLQVTDNYEIGYKGLIGDKLGVTLDVYSIKREGFTLFSAVGPTILYTPGETGADLGAAVEANLIPFLTTAIGDAGLAAQVAAQIGAGYAAGGDGFAAALPAALNPIFGAVESNRAPKGDGVTHSMAGYRTSSDAISYWGLDLGLEYYLTSDLSVFGNYSYTSQNSWIPGESNDDGISFPFYLNSPQNKYRIGANYTPAEGFRGSVSYQHDDSYFGNFGQFRGDTDVVDVIDMSVGYNFGNGLTLDIGANNLFDNKYSTLPNFPKIGRRVVAKVRYTFGTEKG